MAVPSRAELLALDVETRLELIELLWESIASDPQASARLPISDAERAIVEERLGEHRENPSTARPWSEVRDELFKRR